MATSPLPSRGSPPLHSGGQNQNWPTCGQSGYVTPAVLGIPTAAERGAKSEVAHLWAKWLRHPTRDPHRFRSGGKIRMGALVGKLATSPPPSCGSPPLQIGGQNQKWPTCGQSGYVTPAVSGIPTASERRGGSKVAHKWAKWLRHPCLLGDPHRFRAVGKITSGTLVGKVATSPLPSRGSPPLRSGGQNQNWPTCAQSGYVTPAVSGIPTAAQRWAKSQVAHLWAKWLRHPCRLGDPHRFRAGGKIRMGALVGKLATSPLPSWGCPPLHSGGQNQNWPTCGQTGYVTPAVLGIPTAAEQGGKSEVAHLGAKWPRHPCRLGDPHRCRAGGKIRIGPLVGKVATLPLPSWGSPPLQTGGQNQKWPTCGQSGYVTPAVLGIPTAAERGGQIRSGPQVGKVATSPLPSRGSPALQSGGQNHKWHTCGQSGYVIPAVSGIPTASKRGAKSELAHLWAKWLRHPYRLGDPHRFRAGGKIRIGPLVRKVATSPLPSWGTPPLQTGGQNQKWPKSGQSGYVTPAVLGIPTAAERGAKSEVAHLWAKWLRHPCRLGDSHRCRAGGEIRSGPLVGKVATSPLPFGGSPPLQSERGESKVAHKWAKWLRHPCRLRDPHRCTAGGKIRIGPLVGKVATSPLPSGGSPPLQSERGESKVAHKWAKWLRHPCRLGDPHRYTAGGKIRSGPLMGKVATSPLPS